MTETPETMPDAWPELVAERDRLARDVATLHDGINAAAREALAQRREHRQQLDAIDHLAAALGDHALGDAWTLVDAIRRLCNGEITPEQALDATGTD
ncbi:hypothetical protein N0X72_25420 [Streptomyces carpaticus]|uniref:hypothetical protein n=1 Tax=Streptomyces carpaticus TaxID=285558 RepID=UPI002202FB82|nr:hypothetical protein N0X72_25420 [Streptomyces carpaticus]